MDQQDRELTVDRLALKSHHQPEITNVIIFQSDC